MFLPYIVHTVQTVSIVWWSSPGCAVVSQSCGHILSKALLHQSDTYPRSTLSPTEWNSEMSNCSRYSADCYTSTPTGHSYSCSFLWISCHHVNWNDRKYNWTIGSRMARHTPHPCSFCLLALALEVLMFSMFSMLLMQLFCTLLHASRMQSQKLRWPSELNQLPGPAHGTRAIDYICPQDSHDILL